MTIKPKILVVDDDLPILLLMKNVLKEFGFETLTASSGTAALEIARKEPVDLILLDMKMPGMSGEEALRALRDEPLTRETPIVILSGDPVGTAELQVVGADAALQKPFDLNDLVTTIKRQMENAECRMQNEKSV